MLKQGQRKQTNPRL